MQLLTLTHILESETSLIFVNDQNLELNSDVDTITRISAIRAQRGGGATQVLNGYPLPNGHGQNLGAVNSFEGEKSGVVNFKLRT